LTSIKGYLEALSEMESSLPAEGKKFLSILLKQSERMENIVSDLLQLAKIESGKEKLQITAIPIKPFIEKVLSSLSSLAQKKSQTLEIEASEDLILQADSDKLSRILINLLRPKRERLSLAVRKRRTGLTCMSKIMGSAFLRQIKTESLSVSTG
jgi:two-component system phosphate regulon sensor histidine kinase PhoR